MTTKKYDGIRKLTNAGIILAVGCPDRKTVEKTDFPKMAYEFGKSL